MEVTLNKKVRKMYGKTLIYYSTNKEEITVTLYPKFLKEKIKDIKDYPDTLTISLKV